MKSDARFSSVAVHFPDHPAHQEPLSLLKDSILQKSEGRIGKFGRLLGGPQQAWLACAVQRFEIKYTVMSEAKQAGHFRTYS